MLEIEVGSTEDYDEANSKFIQNRGHMLQLEHSLVSISKWESIWEVPFMGDEEKSTEQTYSYIMCMDLGVNTPPEVFEKLTGDDLAKISAYIDRKMTATWFRETKRPPGRKQTITNELVYYWMIAHTIPAEYQHWHFNRLLTLIKVCQEQNSASQGKKNNKPSPESLANRAAMNARRQAEMKTTG